MGSNSFNQQCLSSYSFLFFQSRREIKEIGEELAEVTGEHIRGSKGKMRRVVRESKMPFSCSKYLD